MPKHLFLLFILMGLPVSVVSQGIVRTKVKGKVIADARDLEGIYIVNSNTEAATQTQSGGYFEIPVAVGDTLMFSSVQFKATKRVLTEDDFCKELVFVPMKLIMNQLEEVMVFQYKNINAVALGIIPKGQKRYTPAERKLKGASDVDAQIGLNTSLMIDPLLNFFSGRTAMLQKELAVEKKEFGMQRIENLYPRDYFLKTLKIPEEYVKGFEYYLIENTSFVRVMNTNNKVSTTFLMVQLAEKYLDSIKNEK